MKNLSKVILIILVAAIFTACDKKDFLPSYNTGTKISLAASATILTPLPADADKNVLTVSWTNPGYATAATNVKYVVEIDLAGKDFTTPLLTKTVSGAEVLSTNFTAKEINTVLVNQGYAFNVPVSLDVRVSSSYANNNDRYISDVIRIKYSPYKVPPKVALPSSTRLFIVGSATVSGWNNPVQVPNQEFTRIDETTWGGIFQLAANQSYLLLPVNGDWGAKYGGTGANNSNNPLGADFKADGSDLMAPPTSGLYKMIFDFQSGKFTVTPFTQLHGVPSALFIVGDASPGGWNNPVPLPSQQFTRVTSTKFELTIPLTAGKNYLILPENGNWGKKFGRSGAASNTKLAGTIAPEGGDMPSPDVTGTYKITVDFLDNSYSLVKI